MSDRANVPDPRAAPGRLIALLAVALTLAIGGCGSCSEVQNAKRNIDDAKRVDIESVAPTGKITSSTPTVTAEVRSQVPLDPNATRVSVDGKKYRPLTLGTTVRWQPSPPSPLHEGVHTVVVTVRSIANTTASRTWTFEVTRLTTPPSPVEGAQAGSGVDIPGALKTVAGISARNARATQPVLAALRARDCAEFGRNLTELLRDSKARRALLGEVDAAYASDDELRDDLDLAAGGAGRNSWSQLTEKQKVAILAAPTSLSPKTKQGSPLFRVLMERWTGAAVACASG